MFIENEKEEKLKKDQKLLKKDIVFDYCKVRPTSALAIIEEEMGVGIWVLLGLKKKVK